ncbi:MAG: prolyl oligopeptidase family serine peptidase [Armatimonadetes bacterium]|nr:prolyl oligopeptidase family serine peptidase [Armatimonadota bacterium]
MRWLAFSLLFVPAIGFAQDRLPEHPKYKQYLDAQKASRDLMGALSTVGVYRWGDDGRYVVTGDGKAYDLQKKEIVDYKPTTEAPNRFGRGDRRQQPGRGRQFATANSPDGKWVARYEDSNLYLEDAKNSAEKTAVTTDGSAATRIKYATGSWVYGEELGQRDAMWWSPDSSKLVFYRFDESKVKDYYVTLDEGGIQDRLYTEAYPKAGANNPLVQLLVYDVHTKSTIRIDTEFKSTDPDIAQYIYDVRFSPDGKEILFDRTNRKQNVFELVAADPATGACRVVLQETNPNGWVDNTPTMIWLEDGKRFLWFSEKTGYWNVYLASLDKGVIAPVTKNSFEVENVVKVDEKKGVMWYMAHSAPNPYLLQLHRVKLNGSGDTRLTDPGLGHTVQLSENENAFIDREEALGTPPKVQLCDANGKVLTQLGAADVSDLTKGGFKAAESFTCLAADGKTKIYGYIQKPSDFDASKKYPVILSVYGGPDSGSGRERYLGNSPDAEFGFIHAWIDGRGTKGRGRDFRQAPYRHLGIVEIDDQAAAMQALAKMPYIDGSRIGIEGTSYGGYSSVMAILRHPETFAAAVAGSPVTAWYNYDSIYTERFMDTPQNNPDGYREGSAMEYAKNLTGKLCIYIGTADDNVHPANTYQLINALDRAAKPYRLYAGVDQGHSGLRFDRKMEFFIDALKP